MQKLHADELDIDDALVRRLLAALIALPYYKETNPLFAKNALYVAGEILGQANVRS